jgi:hypothetical protein
MPRCPNGTRRNKKTGNCEKFEKKTKSTLRKSSSKSRTSSKSIKSRSSSSSSNSEMVSLKKQYIEYNKELHKVQEEKDYYFNKGFLEPAEVSSGKGDSYDTHMKKAMAKQQKWIDLYHLTVEKQKDIEKKYEHINFDKLSKSVLEEIEEKYNP